jgi:hypothetical protein
MTYQALKQRQVQLTTSSKVLQKKQQMHTIQPGMSALEAKHFPLSPAARCCEGGTARHSMQQRTRHSQQCVNARGTPHAGAQQAHRRGHSMAQHAAHSSTGSKCAPFPGCISSALPVSTHTHTHTPAPTPTPTPHPCSHHACDLRLLGFMSARIQCSDADRLGFTGPSCSPRPLHTDPHHHHQMLLRAVMKKLQVPPPPHPHTPLHTPCA